MTLMSLMNLMSPKDLIGLISLINLVSLMSLMGLIGLMSPIMIPDSLIFLLGKKFLPHFLIIDKLKLKLRFKIYQKICLKKFFRDKNFLPKSALNGFENSEVENWASKAVFPVP